MAKIVSLNRVRKAKDRLTDRVQADANALKFGQTKAEKTLQVAKTEKARRDLEGVKRE
jgi:hypothetical protein